MYPTLWIVLSVFVIRQAIRWKTTSREEKISNRYFAAVRRKHRVKTIPSTMGLHELANHFQDPVCEQFANIFGAALYSEHSLTQEEYQKLLALIRILEKNHSRD